MAHDRTEPLWDRIDKERVRVALFVAAFAAAVAVSAGLFVGAVGAFLGVVLVPQSGTVAFFGALPWMVVAALVAGAAGGGGYVAHMLVDPHRRLLGRLGARRSDVGTLLPTKSALHDMSVAAGFKHPPQLWLIDECERVNAFALGFGSHGPVVGVTQGFLDRLSIDSQRAVFANLLARLRSGDTFWATMISAVMGPIWERRERQLRKEGDEDTLSPGASTGTGARTNEADDPAFFIPWFILSALSVIVTDLLMAGHQRAAREAATKADAEGMLLLKDPHAMLVALETVLEANNTVPSAGEAYSMLFYCWAGFGFAPEDDPEMQRIARLREVLGAEGMAAGAT